MQMIPLIFKRKKTAEYLRQNSGDQDDRKKHGHGHPSHRPRTLEDHNAIGGTGAYLGGKQSYSFDTCGINGGGLNSGGGSLARQGGGCNGTYLGTDGYIPNYYDYNGPGGAGGGPSQQQRRRSPSPVGSGEWALRECEFHTTWLNDLRKRLGQQPITDLRTAVADGITIVQLTAALTNSEAGHIEPEGVLSKPQALVNLDRCLARLAACGVDVIGIQANDLAEGDLKSSLLLLTQIRRRYETLPGSRTQGDGDHAGGGVGGRGSGEQRVTVLHNHELLDMPGRIDTSPRLQRPSYTADTVTHQMNRSSTADEGRMIPGMMTSEEHTAASGSHHGRQHSDAGRFSYPYNSTSSSQHATSAISASKPSPALRSAATHHGVTSERPPSQLGVAWAADFSSKPRQTPESAVSGGGPAVEDRLRQLMIDTQRSTRPIQYNDDELILPHPPSRDFGDGVTLGGVSANHSASFGQPGEYSHQQSSLDLGYVPSRPSERRTGPRTDSMMHRDSSTTGQQQPDPYPRPSATPSGGQFTNYTYESQPSPPYSESQRSVNSVQRADLRSAWNKLYGTSADFRPPSRHDVTSSPFSGRRVNAGPEELLLQPLSTRSSNATPSSHGPFATSTSSPAPAPQHIRRHSQPPLPDATFPMHPPPPGGGGGGPAAAAMADAASFPHPVPRHPRESPMGQSSSTQGQTSDSSYRSSHSGQTTLATFKPDLRGAEKGEGAARKAGEDEEDADDDEVEKEMRALGPASKYPDNHSVDSRPPSARQTPQTGKTFGLRDMFPAGRPNVMFRNAGPNRASPKDLKPSSSRDSLNAINRDSTGRGKSKAGAIRGAGGGGNSGVVDPSPRSGTPNGAARVNPAFVADSEDDQRSPSEIHALGMDRLDAEASADGSIFDYGTRQRAFQLSETSSNRSVTPPLPPLSPSSSQLGSAPSTPSRGGGGGGGGDNSSGFHRHHHQHLNNPVSRPHSSQGAPQHPGPAVRQRSNSAMGAPRTPDLLVTSSTPISMEEQRTGGKAGVGAGGSRHRDGGGGGAGGGGDAKNLAVPGDRRNPHGRSSSRNDARDSRGFNSSNYFARSRSLDDLRESGNESNGDLSFDVETTMLTVAPSDISEMGEPGDLHYDPHHQHHHPHHHLRPSSAAPHSTKEARDLRGQLDRLESMYQDVIKKVGAEKTHHGGRPAGRRWSIASSDTSSLRKGRHLRGGGGGASSSSNRPSKDFKSIQRRFQRLESHVVTLARSLAHLSSELRAHNALRRDMDAVKRELRELKKQGIPGAAAGENAGSLTPHFEKFRGWLPSLTNPKRINKLTQFFGQEPPLLEIFLKKLGYERYAKNFTAEHIGMIELPYMTEDRLESIGIPMGPRLRILQESQLCFRQENFDIYIV